MKSCIRIPRVFLPRNDFEKWAAIACDRFAHNRLYWERVAQEKGGAPSALSCIFPDAFLGDEDELRIKEVRESMYTHLESGVLERLNRGMIYVERTTSYGLRRGLLANIDLEEVSLNAERGAIRTATETLPQLVEARKRVRQAAVLEFPHAVLLYSDKRDKVLRGLNDDLEPLYDVELQQGGGKIAAYFVPDADAEYTVHDLIARADPCFIAVDGNHSLAGAKAHWEEIKATLSDAEARNHPARFMLAEFVNVYQGSVVLEPMHRVVKGIETEAFCDFFARNAKCKREGKLIFPIISGTEDYAGADKIINEFIRQNYGRVEYRTGRPSELIAGEDCAVVALPAVAIEELYAAVKSGKRFPAKTFCLGADSDARYSMEGREISYD